MSKGNALIAMSGGVDSSVAAYLMIHAGFNCAGVTMKMCDRALLGQDPPSDAHDAENVARVLNIPFHILDATEIFRCSVVDSFIRSYEAGDTPNPCVTCNQRIKFGWLLEKALELGYEILVTGHYAQVLYNEKTGRYLLKKAADINKDQSYFLACLRQEQLAHIRFPLGELDKQQVRQIAAQQGFINAGKHDSQDICFIPDGDYRRFMERYTGKQYPAGDYLDLSGNVVGRHSGAVGYTIGQRKGLGIAMGEPVYVCGKDMKNNTVTVGPNNALFRTSLRASDWNWLAFPTPTEPIRVLARVRYRHKEQPATVYPEEKGYARVVFDEPQRAITAGQAVVLYDGDLVIGSGTITEVL